MDAIEVSDSLVGYGMWFEDQNPEIALSIYCASTFIDSTNSLAFYRAGKLLARLGRHRLAHRQLARADMLTPKHNDTVASLIKSLLKDRKFHRALQVLDENHDILLFSNQHAGLAVATVALNPKAPIRDGYQKAWANCPAQVKELAVCVDPLLGTRINKQLAPRKRGEIQASRSEGVTRLLSAL